MRNVLISLIVLALAAAVVRAADVVSIEKQEPNTWVKRSPLTGGPPSPRLGYESSWGYDQRFGKMIRWGGHDPGGGGPQLSETWTFDLNTCKWDFLTPNNNPPGNCCCRESAMDPNTNVFYRFSHPAFGHGWMWDRARYLREDSVWTFDLASNRWTNMRPGKEPHLNVGKPVFYDPNHGIFWVYDTRLRAYDPYTNTWHVVNESTKVIGSDKGIGKRTYAGMALDPERNKIVLYGDHYQQDTRTLVYDIAKDEWIDMKPEGGPTAARATPTMVYDSVNKIMLCVMQSPEQPGVKEQEGVISRKMETWTYDLGSNKWTKMNPPGEPDNGGNRDKLLAFLPDKNIFAFEARTSKEQQIWTYRYKAAPPVAANVTHVTALKAETLADGKVKVSWEPVKGVKYYSIDGGTGPTPWQVRWTGGLTKPLSETSYVDSRPKTGEVWYYRVVPTKTEGVVPPTSDAPAVRTQPRLVINSRVDVLAKDKVVYSWDKSADADVVGYVVERAAVRPVSAAQKVATTQQYSSDVPMTAMAEKAFIGEWHRLTDKPIAATELVDNVDLTKPGDLGKPIWSALFAAKKKGDPATRPEDDKGFNMSKPGCPLTIYAYRVRAVNRLGVEGGPSPYQLTIPNEVENLFTKEDGKDAQIRWQPSPHAGVRGYLIYRVNGQYSTTNLLTPEPIKETTFTDKTADGKGRRYYVVAVDALGQQGIPTHGAWAFRGWGQIYTQFYAKDGWHQ